MKSKSGGRIIRELRLKKEISLKELGDLIDTNYVLLSRIEMCREIPSKGLIEKLITILNYEGDQLIFNDDNKDTKKIDLDNEPLIEISQFFKNRKRKSK